MYELGQWFRTRYDIFLPEKYNPGDIYVRSTQIDRTLMSASVALAGLYPPVGPQIWNKDILWQPIPVHTIPTQLDRVLYIGREGVGKTCKKYKKLFQDTYASPFFRSINEQYANFYKEFSGYTGWNISHVQYFAKLQSALYTYENYDPCYLPDWYRTEDYPKINYLAGLEYARYTFTRDMKRLAAGPFFYYLIRHFERFVDDLDAKPKFLMLSAHQTTIAGILNAMDLFDYKTPEYCATVIWELRKNRKGLFINILYNRKGNCEPADQLKIKNCGMDCKFGEFREFLKPIVTNSTVWEQECML